jgi:hypothetical protein
MLTGLMAIGAMAASNPALRANIPFDFVVNGKHMPAGDYIITRGDFPGALTITAKEGGDRVIALYQNSTKNGTGLGTAVVFYGYGDTHFLKEVWGLGENGATFGKSKAEKEMLSHIPVRATVAASLSR